MRLQTVALAYPLLSTAVPGSSLVSSDSPWQPRLTLKPGMLPRDPEISDFIRY
jgi:hypothetical protein